jgi:amino-acid N-acetyltransferase
LRRATEADQDRIKEIIHEVGINPSGLSWQRFLLAEVAGTVIGTGQIKPHGDGSRELASIAVLPAYEHRGIGSQIIRALLEGESDTIYLMCQRRNEAFYQGFGFSAIAEDQMPRALRRIYYVVRVVKPVGSVIGHELDIVIMRRELLTA